MKVLGFILSKDWAANVQPLTTFIRDVRSILTNGWTIRDQAQAELVSLAWLEAEQPKTIRTKLTARPLFIVCVSAVLTSTPESAVSGLYVVWAWDGKGSVVIHQIEGLTGPDAYDVTLWLQGG